MHGNTVPVDAVRAGSPLLFLFSLALTAPCLGLWVGAYLKSCWHRHECSEFLKDKDVCMCVCVCVCVCVCIWGCYCYACWSTFLLMKSFWEAIKISQHRYLITTACFPWEKQLATQSSWCCLCTTAGWRKHSKGKTREFLWRQVSRQFLGRPQLGHITFKVLETELLRKLCSALYDEISVLFCSIF